MSDRLPFHVRTLRRLTRSMRQGFIPLVFAPFFMWAAYAYGGEPGLIVAGGLISIYMLALAFSGQSVQPANVRDMVTGLDLRQDFLGKTREILDQCAQAGRSTIIYTIDIDGYGELIERYGQTTCDRIMETIADRVMICMRADDAIARISDSRLAIGLHPVKRIDIELALQIAARLQSTLEEPIAINASSVYVTVSVGFCTLSRAKLRTPEGLLDAATTALNEARRSGPSAIRAFSSEMKRIEIARRALVEEAADAFRHGHICAWFQPQISTDTGHVSGIEALARWVHPERGIIAPAEFLPALEQAGLMDQLSETMLTHALSTLRLLDLEGVDVQLAGVNFSAEELRNPKLVDRIRWELDRHELTPERLAVEILETVVAGAPDDVLMCNITGLSKLGCQLDLDDFGTGHASITSLRQFPIHRLKIDRSFVTKCDTDPDQQRMLNAILTMAERLGMETLAEGLETAGEHALVSQLGVDHVQGFGIARPMPPDMLPDWIRTHEALVSDTPIIGGATG